MINELQCKEIFKLSEPIHMISSDNNKTSTDKSLEAMRHFSEQYAKRTGTYFCSEPSVTAVVIEGLAKHKDELGAPLCPCRHYEDKQAEVSAAYWNCPCVPMRERKECHCMLFLTPDNEFAGDQQEISLETIKEVRASMG
jgi:ferredoxin-thioredoxin reductase catalytic chain